MHKHHRVESGSCACTHGPSFSAQYIGLMYNAASLSKRLIPSRASLTHSSTGTEGFKKSFFAESLTRAQWRSRSGVTPSKALAPSNTIEQSQAACVRGPMMPMLPSCQSFLKYVHVFDQPSPIVNRLPPRLYALPYRLL